MSVNDNIFNNEIINIYNYISNGKQLYLFVENEKKIYIYHNRKTFN